MDIFNKKKIAFLDEEIERLWYSINRKEKDIKDLQEKPTTCFAEGDYVNEKYILNKVFQHLRAIEEYLKIEVKPEWIDDPSAEPRMHPKIKIYKAHKL